MWGALLDGVKHPSFLSLLSNFQLDGGGAHDLSKIFPRFRGDLYPASGQCRGLPAVYPSWS